ncbi:hypothetical protein V2J09_000510 [Rumex salicifolius]
MKRGQNEDFELIEEEFLAMVGSTRNSCIPTMSYKDKVAGPVTRVGTVEYSNPIWVDESTEEDLVDDVQPGVEDPSCPCILLTAEEKKRIRQPWRQALIVKVFGRNLKGDFMMVDLGNEYYVIKFSNDEDFNHVLTNGLWLIGESYLSIQRWRPNFIAKEKPIIFFTAWIHIPNLSMEYFDERILRKIGAKVGRVMKIHRTTSATECGKFTRMRVEIDITKPLLEKFQLNNRVWKIQYEGFRMICFQCGKVGHTKDKCEDATGEQTQKEGNVSSEVPELKEKFGSWMLPEVAHPRVFINKNVRSGAETHGSKVRVEGHGPRPNEENTRKRSIAP